MATDIGVSSGYDNGVLGRDGSDTNHYNYRYFNSNLQGANELITHKILTSEHC